MPCTSPALRPSARSRTAMRVRSPITPFTRHQHSSSLRLGACLSARPAGMALPRVTPAQAAHSAGAPSATRKVPMLISFSVTLIARPGFTASILPALRS